MTDQPQPTPTPVSVFYSYAYEDKDLRDTLEKHLSLLQRRGFITNWHDRKIEPGTNRTETLDSYLNTASIILRGQARKSSWDGHMGPSYL